MVTDAMACMADATTGLEAFFADSGKNAGILRLASDKMADLLVPHLESALGTALEKGEIAISDTGFTTRFIVCGSLGALNAGGGTPSERVRENMAHLPKTIARILGMDPRKLTLDKET